MHHIKSLLMNQSLSVSTHGGRLIVGYPNGRLQAQESTELQL